MGRIAEETAVRDVAVQHPRARAVLERFGIDYCCHGAKDLRSAAQDGRVSLPALMKALDDALDDASASAESAAGGGRPDDATDWTSVTAAQLADHIETRHHEFLRRELPRLHSLFEKVIRAHDTHHGSMLRAVQRQFDLLRSEIEMHLRKEEEILFPYIRDIEAFARGGGDQPAAHCGSVRNPILQMEHEHESAGAALERIRELTGSYALPEDACATFAALYKGLRALEADLHEHIHLENNILFPRAIALEGSIRTA